MHAYEIISQVFDRFRGLPVRMAEIFGNSPEWYRSQGRCPKHLDPAGTGNKSFLDHFFEGFDKIAAASRPAGRFLKQLVAAELERRLADEGESLAANQQQLRRALLKEAAEAVQVLDECDFRDAGRADLLRWQTELDQLIEIGNKARAAVAGEIERRKAH